MRPGLGSAVVVGLGAVFAAAASVTAVPLPEPAPRVLACRAVPVAAHVDGVDPDDDVTIDLALLADRAVTVERAQAVVEQVQASFAPMHLTLRVASVEHVTFESSNPAVIVEKARERFDWERPAGIDAVIVLTSADLTSGLPRGERAAGMVDCVGGVAVRSAGFGVVEDSTVVDYQPSALPLGPLEPPSPAVVEVFAHELGHVFGATHELGNCAEGSMAIDDLRPCTVMSNMRADLLTPVFGSAEVVVIRGYAEEWARP